jgi:hypothetical protein
MPTAIHVPGEFSATGCYIRAIIYLTYLTQNWGMAYNETGEA